MSPRNMTTCPKCIEKENARQKKAAVDAEAGYGKVRPAEYERLRLAREPRHVGETLREYYEMGIDRNGKFRVRYECICDKCGFDFQFHQTAETELSKRHQHENPANLSPLRRPARANALRGVP